MGSVSFAESATSLISEGICRELFAAGICFISVTSPKTRLRLARHPCSSSRSLAGVSSKAIRSCLIFGAAVTSFLLVLGRIGSETGFKKVEGPAVGDWESSGRGRVLSRVGTEVLSKARTVVCGIDFTCRSEKLK